MSQDEVEAQAATSVSVDGQLKSPLVTCILNASDTYSLVGNSSCIFLGLHFLRSSDIEKQVEEPIQSSKSKKK